MDKKAENTYYQQFEIEDENNWFLVEGDIDDFIFYENDIYMQSER